MSSLIFDLETDGLLNEVSKVHCIVTMDVWTGEISLFVGDKERELVVDRFPSVKRIEAGLDLLARADRLIGANIVKYDVPVLEKLYGFRKPIENLSDTLISTRLIYADLKEQDFVKKPAELPSNLYGRHSLEAWGYRLGEKKGEFGKTSDWKTFSPEMLEYCIQDVKVTKKLWDHIVSKNYSEQALRLEHDFAYVIAKQERHGFAFDRDAAVKLYSKLGKRRAELDADIQKVFPGWDLEMKSNIGWTDGDKTFATKAEAKAIGMGSKQVAALEKLGHKIKHIPFNPSSRDHIARALIETHGWKPLGFTPDGKPTVDEEVLSALPYPEAKLLNESFMLEKRIGQLAEGKAAWLKLEKNGRIHGDVNTNGTVTGRCSHSKPNMAQIPAVHVPFGKDCRALFTASDSVHSLIGVDFSSLELRCLSHFMHPYDEGRYGTIVCSGDIHTENQLAAGLPTRDNAKTFIYGFLYGAGDAKIGSIVGKDAKEGKKLREQFLRKVPALRRLREDVVTAARRGYLIGLDGRRLAIRSEHAALNTLLQSAGALLSKIGTVILYQRLTDMGLKWGSDWAQVIHVHDECQIEGKTEYAETIGKEAVKAFEEAGRYFKFNCPITGTYKIGRNWAETH